MKNQSSSGRIRPAVAVVLVVLLFLITGSLLAYRIHQKPGAPSSPTVPKASSPSPSASPSGSAQASASRCVSAGLTLSVSDAGGAAGTQFQSLALKNTSNRPCTVFGYPGASLLSANGTLIGQPATRNTSRTPQTITLAPGQSAFATLGFPNPGNFEPGKCAANATTLRIFPPEETQPLQIPSQRQFCPGFSVTALTSNPQS